MYATASYLIGIIKSMLLYRSVDLGNKIAFRCVLSYILNYDKVGITKMGLNLMASPRGPSVSFLFLENAHFSSKSLTFQKFYLIILIKTVFQSIPCLNPFLHGVYYLLYVYTVVQCTV